MRFPTIELSATLAAASVVSNMWAVLRGDPRMRGLRAAVAALSAAYVVGYAWLLATDDVAAWSSFFRPVALAPWVVVWNLPPILGTLAYQRTRHEVRHLGDE